MGPIFPVPPRSDGRISPLKCVRYVDDLLESHDKPDIVPDGGDVPRMKDNIVPDTVTQEWSEHGEEHVEHSGKNHKNAKDQTIILDTWEHEGHGTV